MARQQQLGTRYAAGQSPVASIWGDTKKWREENLLGDIATSFIPGIAQAGAVQDAQTDFGQGNYGMGTLAALGAVPGLGAITKPIRAGIKAADNIPAQAINPGVMNQAVDANGLTALQRQRLAIRKEYMDDWGEDMDVYFHNSPTANKIGDIEDNFDYRPIQSQAKPGYGQGQGIFTHSGESLNPAYGEQMYAVVAPRGKKNFSGKIDDDSDAYETFIPRNNVKEIRHIGDVNQFGG